MSNSLQVLKRDWNQNRPEYSVTDAFSCDCPKGGQEAVNDMPWGDHINITHTHKTHTHTDTLKIISQYFHCIPTRVTPSQNSNVRMCFTGSLYAWKWRDTPRWKTHRLISPPPNSECLILEFDSERYDSSNESEAPRASPWDRRPRRFAWALALWKGQQYPLM